MTSLRKISILCFSIFIACCTKEIEKSNISKTKPNANLFFLTGTDEAQLDNEGFIQTQRNYTDNTCNETSMVKIKVDYFGEEIEVQHFNFYLGTSLIEEDFTSGECAKNEVHCFCLLPGMSKDDLSQIVVESNEVIINSNYLEIIYTPREEIIESDTFNAEVVFISDWKCSLDELYKPHINLFDYQNTDWNFYDIPENKLDPRRNDFQPVIISEGSSAKFGVNNSEFNCSSQIFSEHTTDRWCVAVEDWFCGGKSDQDYDYIMSYEKAIFEIGELLRLTFRKNSFFAATNDHIIKLSFNNNNSRLIQVNINQLENELWNPYKVESISISSDDYLEENGKYVFNYRLPSGKELFKNHLAEAVFMISQN